ncbi:MAG TPA: site-specific integrase, partial [Chloroflexota bacterium]|nr:site-specific integrase [Chloroflexota bacterium]
MSPKPGRPLKRRRKGEGSIREVRPGSWRGEVMLAGTRRSVSGATFEDVLARLDGLRTQHRGYALPGRGADRILVGAHLDRWLQARQAELLSERQWRNHERNVGLHLKPAVGRLPLADLRAQHLRELYGRLVRTHAAQTVRHIHTSIRQALDLAVSDGILMRNVARSVVAPRLVRRAIRALTADEQRAFLQYAQEQEDELLPLWLVALRTGLRQGELLGLQWPDVDLKRGRLTVQRTLVRVRELAPVYKPYTKSASGMRTIYLPASAVDALHDQRRSQMEERATAGTRYAAWNLVFTTTGGTPFAGTNLGRRFRRRAKGAGLSTELVFHHLRHTAISSYLTAGVPLAEVAQIAGHASPAVTATVYAHFVPRSTGQAARDLEQFLSTAVSA